MRTHSKFAITCAVVFATTVVLPSCVLIPGFTIDRALLGAWDIVIRLNDNETVITDQQFVFFDRASQLYCHPGFEPKMTWVADGAFPQASYSVMDGIVTVSGVLLVEGDIAYGEIDCRMELSEDGQMLEGTIAFEMDGVPGCDIGSTCGGTIKATKAAS